jgi:hypothetical protein
MDATEAVQMNETEKQMLFVWRATQAAAAAAAAAPAAPAASSGSTNPLLSHAAAPGKAPAVPPPPPKVPPPPPAVHPESGVRPAKVPAPPPTDSKWTPQPWPRPPPPPPLSRPPPADSSTIWVPGAGPEVPAAVAVPIEVQPEAGPARFLEPEEVAVPVGSDSDDSGLDEAEPPMNWNVTSVPPYSPLFWYGHPAAPPQEEEVPEVPEGPGGPRQRTSPGRLTTLGLLKHGGDPLTAFFEWHFLKIVYEYLTAGWGCLQGGRGPGARNKWIECMVHLELDMKAQRDLLLLAQSGRVGRTHANHILWKTLQASVHDRSYEDLSRMVTHLVYTARRTFDRPPRDHADMNRWTWSYYVHCSWEEEAWAPEKVPYVHDGERNINTGLGGEPLPPPRCWR